MRYIIRAVDSRRPYVEEILRGIPEAEVYWDTSGNAMTSFLEVCKIIADEPAVLLEDDIILTSNFKEKIEAVILQSPDMLINFFSLGKKNTITHYKKGREFCSNLCTYFPAGFGRKVINSYQDWVIYDKGKNPTAYDFLVGYAWGLSREYITYCPSLVQHRIGKSVIDKKRSSKRQSITFVE